MPDSFTAIWRQCLYSETCQAAWSLYRAGLYGSMSYLADIRDCGDPQILWEAIVEAHRALRSREAGQPYCMVGMAALRHRAIKSAQSGRTL